MEVRAGTRALGIDIIPADLVILRIGESQKSTPCLRWRAAYLAVQRLTDIT